MLPLSLRALSCAPVGPTAIGRFRALPAIVPRESTAAPSAFVLGVPAIPDPRAAWAWIDVGVGLIGARVGGMKLTKYSHACIRLEKDGTVLVLDP